MRALITTKSGKWEYVWDSGDKTYFLNEHKSVYHPRKARASTQHILNSLPSVWEKYPDNKILSFFLGKFKEKKAQP